MKNTAKLLFTGIMFISAILNSAENPELKICSRKKISDETIEIPGGNLKKWRIDPVKSSKSISRDKRFALKLKAIAKSEKYIGGWNHFLNIKVNGKPVKELNELKQHRLLNRPPAMHFSDPEAEKKWGGKPWYSHRGGWNIAYATEFPAEKTGELPIRYDMIEFVWDIDDLLVIDEPVYLTMRNIGDTVLKNQGIDLPPLLIKNIEIVQFEVPETRVPASVDIPLPSPEAIAACRQRMREINVKDDLTTDAIRTKLKNFQLAENAIHKCKRVEKIVDYEAGHIWLSHYWSNRLNADTFAEVLDRAAKAGVRLVKVHAWWADCKAGGKGPFSFASPAAEKDFRKLITMCHQRGMKIIPYVSPSYITHNQKYRPEWSYSTGRVSNTGWDRACTGSPSWRSFFFNNVKKLFRDFPIDGIYVDIGIFYADETACRHPDHVHAFKNTLENFASCGDMMAELYSICKENGKNLYLFDECRHDVNHVYQDYRYIGENFSSMSLIREKTKDLHGKIFFLPMPFAFNYYSTPEMYASTMPFFQFPIYLQGSIKDPEKSRTFEEWYYYFFMFYKEMTRNGTRAYLDIKKCDWLDHLPKDTVVSAYVNQNIYLVAANFASTTQKITFKVPVEDLETGKVFNSVEIPERNVKILLLKK